MDTYEVILHTHVGRQYMVEADSSEEAAQTARRMFMEEGDDGDVLYDEVEDVYTSRKEQR